MTKKITIYLLIAFAFLISAPLCSAQSEYRPIEDTSGIEEQTTAFMNSAGISDEPVGVGAIVAVIIKTILAFLGIIFVILIIYAGFLWMTAAGNDEKISKSKKIMASAVIGLAIVFSAYIITVFVIEKLLDATGTGGGTGTFEGS